MFDARRGVARRRLFLGQTLLAGLTILAVACAPAQPTSTSGGAPAAQPAATKPAEAAKPAADAKPAAAAPTTAPAAKPDAKPAAAKPAGPLAEASSLSLDALYEKAKAEGGAVTFYGGGSVIPVVGPIFEKRFPGLKIEHVDATSDKLVARAVSESKGGKVLGDVWLSPQDTVVQMRDQGLLADFSAPEAAAYPDNLKGTYWYASDTQFYITSWNTNLIKKEDEPKNYEDLANPKYKGKLAGEPRDALILMAFAKYKYKDDAKAIDLWKKIAANDVKFYNGHPQLSDLVASGEVPICAMCNSHHQPPLIAKGAPVNFFLTEGAGIAAALSVFKDAPHPYAAALMVRWVLTDEGQQAFAEAGRIPANPKIETKAKMRPDTAYMLAPEDFKDLPKYDQQWKEMFQLR